MSNGLEIFWKNKWLILDDNKIVLKPFKAWLFIWSFSKGEKGSLILTFATSEDVIGDFLTDIQISDKLGFQFNVINLEERPSKEVRVYGFFRNSVGRLRGCFGEVMTRTDCRHYSLELFQQ
jgi:hypothetical protein